MKISKQSRRPLRLVSLAAILLLVVGFVAATASITPTQAASWNLQWSDEFNGANGTGVDPNNWFYDTGQGKWGTGEIENMTNSTSNVYQDGNGHLVLKALNNGGQWTSGRIETQPSNFAAPAGGILAVEASIQQPNLSGAAAAGYWPAFWMLGTPIRTGANTWPNGGEIDIMEDINGRSSVFGTMHCGVLPVGPCNEYTGIGSGERACPGCQTAFHTYRMEYDKSVSPEQIRWYLDGVNYFTINANQVDASTWTNATNHAFFVILDLAMGGSFPGAFGGGPTSSTVSGGVMLVDYVRVYTMGGSSSTTPPTTVPTTVPPTTTPVSGGFNQSVTALNGAQAQISFTPASTVSWVDVHYTINGGGQQNFRMTNNGGTWQQTVSGLTNGNVIAYSFTYFDTAGHDTGWYSYTFGGSTASGWSSIKAMANNDFVSADNAGASPLIANRTVAQGWEEFKLINNSDGTVSFLAMVNNKYVTADINQGGKLIAEATTIQQWEKFKEVDLGNGTVAFQALVNNQFVSCDLNTGAPTLIADRAAVGGAWEAFVISPV
jgi:hypothetical protein